MNGRTDSKARRRKKFRGTAQAGYCFDEAPAALSGYVTTEELNEALERHKGLRKDTELVCAEDDQTNGTR